MSSNSKPGINIIFDPTQIKINQWKDFVYSHPKGNTFQTPEMFEIFSKTAGVEPTLIAAIDENNEILGLLVAIIQRERSDVLGFFSSRAVIDGGPIIQDDNIEVLDEIIKGFKVFVKRKVIYTLFRNFGEWTDEEKKVFSKHGFNYREHLNILVDLTKSEDELWQEVHKNRKKEIKNGLRKGVVVKLISIKEKQNIDSPYQIIKNLYDDLKLPLPEKLLFQNSSEILSHDPKMLLFGAYVNDELIGVRFVICYKNDIYDWYAGSIREYLNYRPNDILPWEIFKWGKTNNYSTFDFGGAGDPKKPYGVRDYKLKFGGNLVNYGRFLWINYPMIYFLGTLYLKLIKIIK